MTFVQPQSIACSNIIQPFPVFLSDVNSFFDISLYSKRTRNFGVRLILFLYIRSFLQNQPQDELKVFLKLFLEIIY